MRIEGMNCGSCVARVERALGALEGIAAAHVNLTTEIATIELNQPPPKQADIIRAIREAGYDAEPVCSDDHGVRDLEQTHAAKVRPQKQAFVQALCLSIPIVALHWLGPILQSGDSGGRVWPRAIQAILSLVLLASSAGAPILVSGVRAALHRSANMDLLVSLGVTVAFVSGVAGLFASDLRANHFHALAMILALVNLGRYFEMRAKRDASGAVSALVRRMPTTAELVTLDGTKTVTVSHVAVGDKVRVAADTVVPVDGRVVEGEASVDESAVTGEPMPRDRRVGDTIAAGCIVREGLITMEATDVGDDSTIGRIVRAVEEAQAGKTDMQRIADRIAGVFVPIVIVLAIATFVAWYWRVDTGWAVAATRAIAVLVIACPCAMGLATPAAVLVSTSAAALGGILVRDAAALEAAGRIDVMLLDKTGTLTLGRPVVKNVFDDPVGPITGNEKEIVQLAASAERYSQHPLARAIVAKAREWNLPLTEPSNFTNEPGLGVAAEIDGRTVLVGGSAFFKTKNVDTAPLDARLARVTADGQTAVLVAVDNTCAGLIGLADAVRPEASRAMEELAKAGVSTAMLTGDQSATAVAVAGAVGIADVQAEMSPEGKCEAVQARRKKGERVAFVGDGINDAPALAAADVGITFASATDVAAGAADIIILRDDLRCLGQVIALARRSVRIIRQNFFWAFFYNAVAIPLAMWGKVPPGVAAGAMMCSSISVVLNSLRLRRTDPPTRLP